MRKKNKMRGQKIKVLYYVPFFTGKCEARHARMHDVWHYMNRLPSSDLEFDYTVYASKGENAQSERVVYPPLRRFWGGEQKKNHNSFLATLHNFWTVVYFFWKIRLLHFDVFHAVHLDSVSKIFVMFINKVHPRIKIVVGPNIMSTLRHNQVQYKPYFYGDMISKIIAVGIYHAQELEKFGVPAEKLTLLPPTVDPFYFSAKKKQTVAWPLFKILFAGKLSKFKGADTFLKALELLVEEGIDFRATLAGNSIDYDLSQHPSLNGKVSQVGYVSRNKMGELYGRHHVYVHSGTDEFGPTTIIESLACGTPCILSDLLSFKEYDHYKICDYFPVGDHRKLKDCLVRFYRKHALGGSQKNTCNLRSYALDHSESIGYLANLYRELAG